VQFGLWQRQPWGYVVAVIMNIKGATYASGTDHDEHLLAAATTFPGAADLLPLWIFFTLASLIATGCAAEEHEPAREGTASAANRRAVKTRTTQSDFQPTMSAPSPKTGGGSFHP
jgi:hypothetical protein